MNDTQCDQLCRTIYSRITSTDIIDLILIFRLEFYIQELIDECIQTFETYDKLYDEYIRVYHYYDMFIFQQFKTLLYYADTSVYFQLTDLVNCFRSLKGQQQPEYLDICQKFEYYKDKVNFTLDDESIIFGIESIVQLRTENSNPEMRKKFTPKLILGLKDAFDKQLEILQSGLDAIQAHAEYRLKIFQFIIRWVYIHTAGSWTYWLKTITPFFEEDPSEQVVYTTLHLNRKAVQRFLEINLHPK